MVVNGEKLSLNTLAEPNITSLLEHFKLSKEHIAIEYNKKVLKKKDYESITLSEDDKIEILHFVGGG